MTGHNVALAARLKPPCPFGSFLDPPAAGVIARPDVSLATAFKTWLRLHLAVDGGEMPQSGADRPYLPAQPSPATNLQYAGGCGPGPKPEGTSRT